MAGSQLVFYGEELRRVDSVLRDLWRDAVARAVFLIDRNGVQLASAGEAETFDATSLATLTAGNVAATDGLAQLIGEQRFSSLVHEGEHEHIHISMVAGRCILLVIFDEHTSLGLVRLRVRQASLRLEDLLRSLPGRQGKVSGPLSRITDEDIDALFSE